MPAARGGPLAQVHGDADALVAVVLDGVHRALAHRHGKSLAFRHVALAGARAQALCMRQHVGGELLQLRLRVAEATAVFHGALS